MPTFPARRQYIDEIEGVQLGTLIDNAELQALQSRQEQYTHNQFGHLHYGYGYISKPQFSTPSERRITLQYDSLNPFRCYTLDAGYWSQIADISIDYAPLTSGVAVDRYDYLFIEIFKYIESGQNDCRLNIYHGNSSPSVSSTPNVTTSTRNISIEEQHVILPLLRTRRYQTISDNEIWPSNIIDHIFIGNPSKVNIAAVNSAELIQNLNAEKFGGYSSESFLSIAKASLIESIYNIIGDYELIKGLWLFDSEDDNTQLIDRINDPNNAILSTYPRRLNPEKKGMAYTLNFSDSEKYFSISDKDSYSFTTGTSDKPFSLCVLANPSGISSQQNILSKFDDTGEREYQFGLDSGNCFFLLYDNASSGYVYKTASVGSYTNAYHTWVSTYSGNGDASGLNIYYDGILKTATSGSYGTYSSMKNTSANIMNAVLNSSAEVANICYGQYAFAMIVGGELTVNQIADLNNLLRSYILDINAFYKYITFIQNQGDQKLIGSLTVDNIKIDGNTISSTDTNGDINIITNGTGDVIANNGYIVTFMGVLASAPTIPKAGMIYKNSGDGKYYIYNGSSWDALT